MKIYFSAILFLIVGTSLFAQGIQFEQGSLEQALQKAKEKNRLVFMDCYTTWCGPCKHLSEKIFTRQKVGEFFNTNFVNIKVDMESEEGKILIKKYPVKAYPTLLYLESNGEIRHIMVGAGDEKRILDGAKCAVDPHKNWSALQQKFTNGERSKDFLKDYIIAAAQARMPTRQASYYYFSQKKQEDLINEEDAQLIIFSVKSISNPVFQYLAKNRRQFYEVVEKERIDRYIENTMSRELEILTRQKKFAEMESKKNELIELDKELGTKVVLLAEIQMSYLNKEQSYKAMAKYGLIYEFDNPERLNEYVSAITFSKHKCCADLMEDALVLASRAVELEGSYKNLDLLAIVLDKTGRSEEGKKYAKDALALATQEQKKNLKSKYLLNPEN